MDGSLWRRALKASLKRALLNQRASLKILVRELLLDGCSACNESDPCCLDFHHLDPNSKDKKISQLIKYGSKKRILKEASKCIVLCSNCHRKTHAGRLLPLSKTPDPNQLDVFKG